MMVTNITPNRVYSHFSQHSASVSTVSKKTKTMTLTERESQQTFTFDSKTKAEVVVGRTDNVADYVPTLDLTPLGAYRLGVSRLHLSIVIEQNAVMVIDLHSANGTYVNNKRLKALKLQRLESGDQLRLGNLFFDVTIS